MLHDVDLFVIGGGSGGVRAARIAADHGARVAIAEEDRYGGTCVVRGCIPKKLLHYAAEFSHAFADAAAFGWDAAPPRLSWSRLLAAVSAETSRLSGLYSAALERRGVEVLRGRARLVGPEAVEIGGRRVRARVVLIATGSRPTVPETPGSEHAITSDEAFFLEELPRRIAIAGGGYVAVEFAGILCGLGCEVTLVHRDVRVLRGFDADVRAAVTEDLARLGVDLRLNQEVAAIEEVARGGPYRLVLSSDDLVEVDRLLCATGRVPNTSDLGLEEAGVALRASGAVIVDDFSQSSVPNIYAVGDCTDRMNLTPVAIREGHAFADSVFGGKPTPIDHLHVPTAVFTRPPAGVVGLTEEEARREVEDVVVYRTRFCPLKHTLTGRDEAVMMKVIVNGGSDRLLGVHLVGADSPEIIQIVAALVKMGAKKADLDAATAVHPTTAEELVLLRRPSA